jgi:serine/threonine-protein kinase
VDTVVSQTPAAGLRVDEGSTVTVFVSNGRVREVPDVTGLSQGEATSELEAAGFDVSVRTRETAEPAEEGIVLSQSPRGGTERSKGVTVTVTVGAPPAPAPEPAP